MPPQPAPAAADTFELYDLRVEVVCPPGGRILCGARDGDYFTLEGEMLYLPPGQGISIYSLGEFESLRPPPPPNTYILTLTAQPPSCRCWPPSSASRMPTTG